MLVAQINPVAFKLFGLEIRWYALIIVFGIIVAGWLATRESKKMGYQEDDIVDFMLWALPLSILGARLYYVIFEWSYYSQHPTEILNIRNGGLAIYGGLLTGALVTYFFTRKRYYSIWKFLDVATPGVIIAQAIGRWGNFANHEAYGGETTRTFLEKLRLPSFIIDNMKIDGLYRQPTFLYESSWNVIGFILLLILRRQNFLRQGEIFLTYVMWYSFGRFFVEGMRTDSLYLFGNIRVSQALSAVLFILAIITMIYRRKVVKPPLYNIRGVR
ncbi:prolipoprotein diacylglyceryl transferase [Vagococcus zengguangii]|uniref:Phosphatidylglycerol--prolipoprotein diacylglyceryl transferase n=1 Tax=Vagococcus zengguangii TaxID=2571750 RepID=A0A4D7CV68_9ENTE|nr:prolipoprotein diacylglyceryl transferase [Vagococcus zengguangii]QCI86217.1 prolipoprotein diacylglyceryl transferase [Vagococcus zengguangii]TLG79880.1 prolipoprotein diacylglyceryl transferase [Vagococcus zengguangii]